MMHSVGDVGHASMEESIKYAVIIVSTVPMMLVYPFVQKNFVKGVMIGAVKGEGWRSCEENYLSLYFTYISHVRFELYSVRHRCKAISEL